MQLLVTKRFSSPNDTQKPRKKTAKNWYTPLTGMTSCTVDSGCKPAPKGRHENWRCSFAFFECFFWHCNKKERTEVIFNLSRPVSSNIRKMAQGCNDLFTLPFGSNSNKSMGENLAENFSCKINVGKNWPLKLPSCFGSLYKEHTKGR